MMNQPHTFTHPDMRQYSYASKQGQEQDEYDEEDGGEEGSQDDDEGEEQGEEDEGEVEAEDGINEGEEEDEDEDEEEEEEDEEDEDEEEGEGEEEVEEQGLHALPDPAAPQMAYPLPQKPMTVRQRKEVEKIARQRDRQQKKELKEREKAERMAKRERERLARIAKKEQLLLESKAAKKAKATVDGEQRAWSIGRPMKGNVSSSQPPARKIKVDNRVETVRRLITHNETGELTIVPTGGAADTSSKTRWCDTKVHQGVTYLVEEDELTLPSDPKGDTKVTPEGILLGGRQYRIPTFTSRNRVNPNKHFMLSIDAARAAGYRDSLYFFRRNPLIQKLPCTQIEKDELITAGFLSGNLKSRAVTMCSARNAFKVMGARFLKDGRHVIDDYYEDAAFANGANSGEIAGDEGSEAQDKGAANTGPSQPGDGTAGPEGSDSTTRQACQSTFRLALNRINPSAAGSATLGLKTIFGGDGKAPSIAIPNDSKERRRRMASHLTAKNWMIQYCRAISEMNRHLRVIRNERMVPFPKYPSIARLAGNGSTSGTNGRLTDGVTDDEEMEWREVEVEMRLNTDGKIMEPGDEVLDTKEEPDDDDDNNSNAGGATAPEPAQVFSRITNPLPPESTITIYGVKNSSAPQEQSHSGEGIPGQGSTRADLSRVGTGSGLHPAQARSPHKRFNKSRGKKANNDWWTTTTRVIEQRPKQPVMGLLDVHTGQPHVRQDTQATRAIWETAHDLEDRLRYNKRQKLIGDSQSNVETDQNISSIQSRTATSTTHGTIMNGPGIGRPGFSSSVNNATLIETVFDDELNHSKRYDLLPGMWDFRSIAL
ncbi:hypothetical protein PSTG_10938 [Puccinia striiformis f. sp. tritici PST-78]|uniref:Uncharacterized protein n=1 Tax=Puccinia striiformis f. sp. tritici PST-78 TaxID=1165861 RepID=A0A0L0V8V8_9BASI|nr:hypothetical protein PSTG_10938 [Puccinia striiformis f. sp. tritici PST-78]